MTLAPGDYIAIGAVLIGVGTIVNQQRLLMRDMEGLKKGFGEIDRKMTELSTGVKLQLQSGENSFRHLQSHIDDHERRLRVLEARGTSGISPE